jgi:enediyne biosynthesis protein E4
MFNRRQFLSAAGAESALLFLSRTQSAVASPLFREIPPQASGLTWVHNNAASPEKFLPETLGPGCAFLDYDNDGWMDIYLVNSGKSDFFQPRSPLRNALYKNNRDGTFTDVTEHAGVPGGTFGMGVAVGDYDNDGFPDIFVTACGRALLYRNNGDGTFTDVTAKAGLEINGWTTSAVWFDFDNDGRLDLFVCSFVRYLPQDQHSCGGETGHNYYCIPRAFQPTASFLFRNNGDGTFTEVGKRTAIGKSLGKGLGVVATDVNNDGRMDLFVANDTVQNFLFVNHGENHWEEMSVPAEVGFSENGQPRSGMGVDAADLGNRGWQDLFVANIDQEKFSLYRNLKDGTFQDVAGQQTIAQATRLLSGWGLHFFDYDNDGELDLILANGHPDDMVAQRSQTVTYREPLLLFQQKNGKFRNVSADAGPAFTRALSARGLAVGDFDNDGRLDVLIGVNGGAPILLRNEVGSGNHWLGLTLRGKTCNRDAVGARLVWSAGGKKFSRMKNGGGSYLSSHDPRMVLGLGSANKVDSLEIHWPAPSTAVDKLTNVAADRYITVVEGQGIVAR